jgi:predicted GNAT superfamily acetyltransferase
MSVITIRELHTHDEFRQVVELERAVWGFSDPFDMVPPVVFTITVKRGAILLGAFDERGRMVGFSYSLVGMKDRKPLQWSHMTGVLNVSKLGCVSEEYHRNVYGESTSALHRGTPTDRLVAEWHITAPHVKRRLETAPELRARSFDVGEAPQANRTAEAGEWPTCATIDLDLADRRLWVEIPARFTEMQQRAPELALDWRLNTREIFETYFGRGYRVVDFALARDAGSGRYLLAKQDEAA